MEENNEILDLSDVKIAIKKMLNLNDLFLDSVKFNQCECYEKYKYVSLELSKQLWVLIDYFDIEISKIE